MTAFNTFNEMLVGGIPKEALRLQENSLMSLRLHPRHAVLESDLCEWARENLRQLRPESDIAKIGKAGYGWLACSFWSNSGSHQRSLTLLKLMYWFITFDDAIDNNSSMCNDPVEAQTYCTLFLDIVFGHGRDPTKTRTELLKEATQKYSSREMLPLRLGIQWWEEMKHGGMPSSQQNRFEAELTKYVMAQVQIVRMNEQLGLKESMPSLLEYVRVRSVAVGAPVSIVACEYDLGIDLDPQILHDPLVQALQSWLNDILSFPKEFRRGELINLVFLIHIENNPVLFADYNGGAVDLASLVGNEERTGSFDAAACRAWEMPKSRYQDCARLAAEIMGSPHLLATPHVKRYVESICSITIGNWAWSIRCGRYNAPTIPSYT